MGYHRKLSLTGQWQFRGVDTMDQGAPLQKCHWPVNDSSDWAHTKIVIDQSMTVLRGVDTMWGGAPLQIVIDRSMTVFRWIFKNCQWPVNDILKQPSKIVIDWTMTIFASIRNGLSQKIVIDRLMTVLHNSWVNTENCHWPVNDNFETAF